MAYLTLYRKYRPIKFEDVIGQEHITRTLINQIKNNRVGHAYLFTGTRGVGKTTIARIFARAINCMEPINGSPCGSCQVCQDIENSLDIIEMDGASNNGVDQVRAITDKIDYPPTTGKYKVYIIDEVHMLTGAAFNALLKTLEEPPQFVVFILCTTEVHKVPATIMSRCMRFDFRLIKTDIIFDMLKNIFNKEHKKYEDEALWVIAENAEGSVRDSLTLAERCISASEDTLTYDDAISALGASDIRQLSEFIRAIINGDASKIILCCENLLKSGKNAAVLSREASEYFRNLIIVKTVDNAEQLIRVPETVFNKLIEIASISDIRKLLNCAELFSRLEGDLRYSTLPYILFEAAAVKAGINDDDDSLSFRIEKIEKQLSNGNFTTSKATLNDNEVRLLWSKVAARAREKGQMLFNAVTSVNKIEMVQGKLVVSVSEVTNTMLNADKKAKEELISLIQNIYGTDMLFKVTVQENEAETMQKIKNLTDGKLTVRD